MYPSLQCHSKVTPWELCLRLCRLFGEKYYSLTAGNQQVSEDRCGRREEETSYPVRNSVLKSGPIPDIEWPKENTTRGQRPTQTCLGSCWLLGPSSGKSDLDMEVGLLCHDQKATTKPSRVELSRGTRSKFNTQRLHLPLAQFPQPFLCSQSPSASN